MLKSACRDDEPLQASKETKTSLALIFLYLKEGSNENVGKEGGRGMEVKDRVVFLRLRPGRVLLPNLKLHIVTFHV